MNVTQWLGPNNAIGSDIWAGKYCYKGESFEEWLDRVSGGDADLRELIKQRKFLFGGRALSNRGTDRRGSMFNCYSSGYAPDHLDGLMELNTNLAMTYRAQGGQGLSLTKIRPKGAPISDEFTSDGIVPFMEMFNATTASISQGGARKGALMMSIDIRHKEAETFITIKTNEDKITKANLSLEVDDEFMNAVQRYYLTGEVIVLHEKREYSGHIVEYDITPINLYKLMIQTNYDWGEPGCLFTERLRNYNLMQYDPKYEIPTTNPCGEQPLPKNFSCNLGSINLAEFVDRPFKKNASFNWDEFREAVHIGVRALDTIIDENLERHALKEQANNSKNYRNIGLGVMGFANMLFELGITYGSDEAEEFTGMLFRNMQTYALEQSVSLAKEKGAFPKCEPELIAKADILQHLNGTDLMADIKKYGLRNCSLLSVAPTGSIATMLGISGGCEPEFALSYTRRTENLKDSYKIYSKSVNDYVKVTNGDPDDLPEYFITSHEVKWQRRIRMQAAMQKYVDTAISSTLNLDYDIPVEEVEQIYLSAWSRGLKGITVFREGCKRMGILSTSTPKEESSAAKSEDELPWGTTISVDDELMGIKRKIYSGCGSFHLQAFFDPTEGRIWETFISLSNGGGCERNLEAISKLISKCLRSGVPLECVTKTLRSVRPCLSYCKSKGATSPGVNCPTAIAIALEDFQKKINEMCMDDEDTDGVEVVEEVKPEFEGAKCPECGEPLSFEGGCNVCHSCGYSKCS